jgi:hypothetical protein
MGKHEDSAVDIASPLIEAPLAPTTTPDGEPSGSSGAIDLYSVARVNVDPPDIEPSKQASLLNDPAKLDAAPQIQLPYEDPFHSTMRDGIRSAHVSEGTPEADAAAADKPSEPANDDAAGSRSRFVLLAASLALAAGFGAMIGALSASLLARTPDPAAPGALASANDAAALRESIVQVRKEISALRSSHEVGARNANAQFAKVGERFSRLEQAQAEPAAKLAQAIQSLERLDRRESASSLTTGSVTPQPAAAPLPTPKPQIVHGWVVRDVYDGTALIEGRRGLIEVSPGDVVPGAGRVEAIRRQDGRWVVITQKGLITSQSQR